MDNFDFDRVTRDLTTDQGLPLDAACAVPIALAEEPVFRCIAMAEAPQAQALRFYEAPLSLRHHEVVLETALPKPVLKSAHRAKVQPEVEMPSVEEQLAPLERTRFEVSERTETLMDQMQQLLASLSVEVVDTQLYELMCKKSCDQSFEQCTFMVRLLKASNRNVMVEMQRRSGCPRVFNCVFRHAKAHWHKCAQVKKPLAAPRLQRSSSASPCAALEAQSPEQWNCLINWINSDASEGIRCVAALATQGVPVPDHVIAHLASFLSSEFKVEAMQAITAAVPGNQLCGVEDVVLQAVSASLSSDSSIEEREACKLLAKLSTHLPHLLRRCECDIADKLTAASRSQWTCVREFAEQSLAVLQNPTEVH